MKRDQGYLGQQYPIRTESSPMRNITPNSLLNSMATSMNRSSFDYNSSNSNGSIRNISNEVFNEYDKDKRGEICDTAISQMLKDIYKLINKDFEPSNEDIKEYKKMLDFDNDGTFS